MSAEAETTTGPTAILPKPTDRLAAARAAKAAKAEAAKAAAATPVPVSAGPDASPLPRRIRKPFGTPESKLAMPARPGYVGRWFNDEPGRIQRALAAGYDHVKNPDGTPVSRTVDKGVDNRGLVAFYMEIPKEFYDEDFAAKQAALDETDKSIYRGKFNEEDGDRRYVPSSGISATYKPRAF